MIKNKLKEYKKQLLQLNWDLLIILFCEFLVVLAVLKVIGSAETFLFIGTYLINYLVFMGSFFILLFVFYPYVSFNLKKKSIKNIEKFGVGISSASLAILTVSVSVVGFLSLAVQFQTQPQIQILSSYIIQQLYFVTGLMVFCVILTYLLKWTAQVIPRYRTYGGKRVWAKDLIASRYAMSSIFFLTQTVLLMLTIYGGYALFVVSTSELNGVEIVSIGEGTVAEKIGLKEGMIINSVSVYEETGEITEDKSIHSRADFSFFLSNTKPNQKVLIKTIDGQCYNATLSKKGGHGFLGVTTKTYAKKFSELV